MADFEIGVLSALTGRGGNAKAFRQLTRVEKERIAQARELYKKFLAEDETTKEVLDRYYGAGKWLALNDPPRRALWMVGHEMQWSGIISHCKRISCMDFWSFTAEEGRAVTDNDPYYMTLGSCVPRQAWEV